MKYELHHDDPPCTAKLTESGWCPECRLYPDMQSTCFYRVLEKGDKVVHNIHKKKYVLTYTGTRRKIKDVLADFFTTEEGDTVFFFPSEVEKMQNYDSKNS